MIKKYILFLMFLNVGNTYGQVLLNEDFSSYNTANLGGQNGWTDGFCGFSCNDNKFKVTTTSLTAPSGTSALCASSSKSVSVDLITPFPECASMNNPSGQSTEKTFASVNSGSIYTSFLVKVNLPSAAQGDMIRIGQNAFSTCFRLMARGTGSSYQFYIQSNPNSAELTDGATRTKGETYFIVVKYTLAVSPNTQGEIKLWVNPTGSSEPAMANITRSANTSSFSDPTSASAFIMPHNSTCVNRPSFNMACLRVGTTWSSVALPIELSSFTAQRKGNTNQLSWKTASEKNNSHFDIERSNDGETNWTKIGMVKGDGSSLTSKEYSFTDNTPLSTLLSGRQVSYYRLKQVDFDGRFEYSNVVSVIQKSDKFNIASVAPNPTKETSIILFESDKNETVSVTLTDVSGRIILTQNFSATEGVNNLTLNMAQLTNGLYLLHLKNHENVLIQKLIKQ